MIAFILEWAGANVSHPGESSSLNQRRAGGGKTVFTSRLVGLFQNSCRPFSVFRRGGFRSSLRFHGSLKAVRFRVAFVLEEFL